MGCFCKNPFAIAFVLLFQSIALSNAKDCQTKFPGYIIDKTKAAKSLGCFHSPGAGALMTGATLKNMRDDIDWNLWVKKGHAKDLIQECGKLAKKSGAKYFGIEYYGECYHGNQADLSGAKVTDQDGCDKFCNWDVGAGNAMVIFEVVDARLPEKGCELEHYGYRIDDKHNAINLGCHYNKDDKGEIFPAGGPKINFRYLSEWGLWHQVRHAGDMIARCGAEAVKQGFNYFGLWDTGGCHLGNSYDTSKFGTAQSGSKICSYFCEFDSGGFNTTVVYQVEEIPKSV